MRKTVSVRVTREAVIAAFQKFQMETGATRDDCIQLLKNAASKGKPRYRELAVIALREVLL